MEVRELDLPGVYELQPKKFGDNRGYFIETYNRSRFTIAGLPDEWVQDNQSLSARIGTLRGLHFQKDPYAQAKLVRVVQGRIRDVAVDIRKGSPHYGKWVALELDGHTQNQILVPAGFAHGFVTLEPDTIVQYKVSNFYASDCDRSIRFDDPDIGVEWELDGATPQLSAKDEQAPLLRESDNEFTYSG